MKYYSTWQHIRKSPYQALLAIAITSLTFFVIGLVVYSALASSALLSYFEKKPQITAFFNDETNEESIMAIRQDLLTTGKVSDVKYVSKDEALRIYQDQNRSDPLLLEMVTAEILPASLEIQTTEPRYLADVASIINKQPGIDEIIYQKDIVDELLAWTATIRKAGVALIVFFSLLSVLVTLTITGMKIVIRRDEIDILRLIGATKGYISAPFVTEGLMYGIIGAFVGWALTYATLLYAAPVLSSLLRGETLSLATLPFVAISMVVWPLTWELMLSVLGILLISGMFLGFLGSSLALSRYVRV